MPEGILHLFKPRPWGDVAIDLLDLVVVTYLIYRALLVLRGTRAMQMGIGLGVIFLVYLAAKHLGLVTLTNLLTTLLSSIILVVVVVFQNDIRRGLMRVGSQAFLGGLARQQESKVIEEVVASAVARSRMFSSSLTLPGKGYLHSASTASSVSFHSAPSPCRRPRMLPAMAGMSSRHSRNGGIRSSMTLSR